MGPADLPAEWPNRSLSRFLRVGGTGWHFQEGGEGPVLLLLHGAGGSVHSFRHLLPLLSRSFHVIAPDLPGQGFSTLSAKSRAGLDPMADDLAALLAKLAVAPAVIVGHSAGGAIALRLSELLPVPPRAVIGINPALGKFDGVAGWLFPFLAKLLSVNPLFPRVFSKLSATTPHVRQLIASTGSTIDADGLEFYRQLVGRSAHVDGTLAMMARWQLDALLSRLPRIGTPTLFLVGSRDTAVPPGTARKAARAMPDARVVEISGAGHLLHEELPGRVVGEIESFLASVQAV